MIPAPVFHSVTVASQSLYLHTNGQHLVLLQKTFMEFSNRVTGLFSIKYPIIQAGMVWASGWKLASAVSNAGALGIIGAGSMYPHTLEQHIKQCKQATDKPFAVKPSPPVS
jgi:hypothetical protein